MGQDRILTNEWGACVKAVVGHREGTDGARGHLWAAQVRVFTGSVRVVGCTHVA